MSAWRHAGREWLLRLWGTISRRRSDADITRELDSHLVLAADDARRRGEAGAGARRRARLVSGATAAALDSTRDQRGIPWIADVTRDARHGLRALTRRGPGFTLAFVLTLGLGIGANAAMFQLFDAIQLRPLPVADAERLAIVELADDARRNGRRATNYPSLTNPLWEQLRDRQTLFTGVLAWSPDTFRVGLPGTSQGGPPARGLFVSGDFFSVLGVPAAAGRVFTSSDDRPGCGTPGAVVSDAYWRTALGADPAAVGRPIRINGRLVDVLGITPRGFDGVEVGRVFDIALPLCAHATLGREENWLTDGGTWWLTVMGRLAPGRTLAGANAALEPFSAGLLRATIPPGLDGPDADDYLSLRLRATDGATGVSTLRRQFREPLLFLLSLTALVLLIICTNLAALAIGRSATREREFAVRLALGSSRGRLVRQIMTEQALLVAVSALIGLLSAGIIARLLVNMLGPDVQIALRVDRRLAGFAAMTAMASWLTFGLLAAWLPARRATRDVLRSSRGVAASAAAGRLRGALVPIQVAVCLVLLVGAFLFTGTLRNLLSLDSGFRHDDVVVARVDFRRATVPAEQRVAFRRDFLDRMRRLPGVAAAAEVRHVPLSRTGSSARGYLEGTDPATARVIVINGVSDGYLETLGVRLLAGRDISITDAEGSPRVALINQALARQLGIASAPLGSRIRFDLGGPTEVVGLIADTKHFTLREAFVPMAMLPKTQLPDARPFTDFVVRATTSSTAAAEVGRRLDTLSPLVDVDTRPLDANVSQALLRERLMATLSLLFGTLAIVIAAIGLYGLMADLVTRRTNEFGLRLALGAPRRHILAIVLRQAASLLTIGVSVGAACAYAGADLAASLLFGLTAEDPRPIVLAALCLSATAAVAALWPACRAVMLSPLVALRHD